MNLRTDVFFATAKFPCFNAKCSGRKPHKSDDVSWPMAKEETGERESGVKEGGKGGLLILPILHSCCQSSFFAAVQLSNNNSDDVSFFKASIRNLILRISTLL